MCATRAHATRLVGRCGEVAPPLSQRPSSAGDGIGTQPPRFVSMSLSNKKEGAPPARMLANILGESLCPGVA